MAFYTERVFSCPSAHSYLAKPDPPNAIIASAAIRRIFRLGLPPVAMVFTSWLMDKCGAFRYNAKVKEEKSGSAMYLSLFGSLTNLM